MSANTAFSTTTSRLDLFIRKQSITNSTVTGDLSSTEYPLATSTACLDIQRNNVDKNTQINIDRASTTQPGFLAATDFDTFLNHKITSITAGSNLISTGNALTPTLSLSISSPIDMSNNTITNLSDLNFKNNVNIKEGGAQRIYTSGNDMILTPNGGLLYISSNAKMNSQNLNLDMNNGVIKGLSNEDYPTNIDIRQQSNKRIYTDANGINLDPGTGKLLYIQRSVVMNNSSTINMAGSGINNCNKLDFGSNTINIVKNNSTNAYIYTPSTADTSLRIDMSNGIINNVGTQDFKTDINITQAGTANKRIYTSGYDMTLTPDTTNGGVLNILSEIRTNNNPINMGGTGNIIGISNEVFNTDINILQGATKRIYTSGNDMTIDAAGLLNIFSDLSMNRNQINMGGTGGNIIGISNEVFNTDINILQNGTQRIYTSGNNMTIVPAGLLNVMTDLSMNRKQINMGGTGGNIIGISNESFNTDINILQNGTQRIYTSGNNMTIVPAGLLNVMTDLSMNRKQINMGGTGGNIIGISNEVFNTDINILQGATKRIYTSGNDITINTSTGDLNIIGDISTNGNLLLNGISQGLSTDNILTYNVTDNSVCYYPLYEMSYNDISLNGGGTVHDYSLNITKILNTITLRYPDVSCVVTGTKTALLFSNVLAAKYRPDSSMNFPVTIFNPTISNQLGRLTISKTGNVYLYNDVVGATNWNTSTSGVGMFGQCFTYTNSIVPS